MATYGFDCASCGQRFDIQASMVEGPRDPRCPSCGGTDVQRCYGEVSVVRHGAVPREPLPGELRPADPRRLTANVAKHYARAMGDNAMKEVADRVERGAGPAELHEFVQEVKAERQIEDEKGGASK